MKRYYMTNESYGREPYGPDTLDNWMDTIDSLCTVQGWEHPAWAESPDGSVRDANTGETILEPENLST